MTTWRHFARKTFPRVVREIRIPCATTTDRARCRRHDTRIGTTTGICLDCHNEAWDEVARRYREQGRKRATHKAPHQEEPEQEDQMSIIENEPLDERELLPAVIEESSPASITLFGTSDPKVALQRMSDVATVLVDVIKDRKLYARISGHEHITAEGWTTLGGMMGVVPVVCWTRPNETGDGYLARVEARTLDGRVVGAAESECSRAERRWKTAEPYAIRSMAQTRAIGRALRAPLGQIVVLAGYEPAAAEEMPVIDSEPARAARVPDAIRPTRDQLAELKRRLAELEGLDPGTDWAARAREIAGVPGDMLTRMGAEILLGKLAQEFEEACS